MNLGQDCTFPTDSNNMTDGGMNKRFYAAYAAMQGLLSTKTVINKVSSLTPKLVCKTAYKFADELLKQENE